MKCLPVTIWLRMKLDKHWHDYWRTYLSQIKGGMKLVYTCIWFIIGGFPCLMPLSTTSGFRGVLTALYVFVIRKRGIVQIWAVQIPTWSCTAAWRPSCLSPSTLTHKPLHQQGFFSTSVSPEHKQCKRPVWVKAFADHPKIKPYVTVLLTERAPPLLSVSCGSASLG